jgi:hypothetical protein
MKIPGMKSKRRREMNKDLEIGAIQHTNTQEEGAQL